MSYLRKKIFRRMQGCRTGSQQLKYCLALCEGYSPCLADLSLIIRNRLWIVVHDGANGEGFILRIQCEMALRVRFDRQLFTWKLGVLGITIISQVSAVLRCILDFTEK